MMATLTATQLAASNEKNHTPGFPSTVTYVRTFSSKNRLTPGIGGHHRGALFDIWNGTTPSHVSKHGRTSGSCLRAGVFGG